MPVDVVKTRLQMDGAGGVKMYNGSVDCARKLIAADGPGALFMGLPPALLRQSTYGSLRYGLYGPIRNSLGASPAAGGAELGASLRTPHGPQRAARPSRSRLRAWLA